MAHQLDNFFRNLGARDRRIQRSLLAQVKVRLDTQRKTFCRAECGIQRIAASGEVAPKGCHLARYQARGQYKAYWYYKLQADTPVFPSKKGQGQLSRYQHLGAAGTQAHTDTKRIRSKANPQKKRRRGSH
ncbi:MAG: hypothetical protein SAL07_13575 [Oscillatoria sp. PMC 1051.18]|nr:hypothetical protein [Oscillatoria sp. PMC 1050.18]MEC5030922.1 hypothetical protein [Oscillatoria sp. PMC 1051.18]